MKKKLLAAFMAAAMLLTGCSGNTSSGSSAANDAPVLPLITMPTIIAPISRTIAIPTKSATNISEPYLASCMAQTNARISPTRKLIKATIGRASGPVF